MCMKWVKHAKIVEKEVKSHKKLLFAHINLQNCPKVCKILRVSTFARFRNSGFQLPYYRFPSGFRNESVKEN